MKTFKIILVFVFVFSIGFISTYLFLFKTEKKDSKTTVTNDVSTSVNNIPSYTTEDNTAPEIGTVSDIPESTDNTISMVMVGDMMFEHPLYEMIRDLSASPYDWVKEIFFDSDIVVGNLETTIAGIENGYPADKFYHFSAPTNIMEKLVEARFDAVNIANNHIMDYSATGFTFTLNTLKSSTIKPFGGGNNLQEAYEPVIVEEKGTKIAFLGFYGDAYSPTSVTSSTPGVAYFDKDLISQAITNAKQKADLVIVWAHWGDEHVPTSNAFQNEMGHWLIDSGADMVVGAHPHVRQNYEQYNGKWIFYSLGNFVTTGMGWDPEAIIGYVLHVTIEDKQISNAYVTNAELSYHGYPDPVQGDGIGLN